MFLGDRILFLEFPRTASRHVRGLLAALPSCHGELRGMHNRIYNLPPAVQEGLAAKLAFGGIRNPWDWYVSLWASGWIRQFTTGEPPLAGRAAPSAAEAWKTAHSEPTPEGFRAFLRMLLDTHRIDAGHGFHRCPLSRSVGFMTHRYVRLYTFERPGQSRIEQHHELERYDRAHNMLDAFVRFEQLTSDLLAILERLGIDDAEREQVRGRDPSEFRSERKRDYRFYYDEPSYELVLRNDAYLIEKHGYRFDPEDAWSPPVVRARP